MTVAVYDQHYSEMIDKDYGRGLISNHGPALVRAGAEHLASRGPNGGRAVQALDIGCNTGAFLEQVQETLGIRAFGLDLNASALAHAVRRSPSVLQAQAERLPFDDASLDLIFSQHTFEHLPEPGFVLREIQRVLRKGGKAFLILPPNLLGIEVIAVAHASLPAEQRSWVNAWRYARQLHCSPLGGPLGGSRTHLKKLLSEHGVKLHVTGGWRWDILAIFLALEHAA